MGRVRVDESGGGGGGAREAEVEFAKWKRREVEEKVGYTSVGEYRK